MRARLLPLAALVVTAVSLAGAGPVRAEPEHAEPQGPAKVAFGEGFPELVDHQWGFPLGGFGGVAPGAPLQHVPVIFVHGNTVDAADWYPVRDDLREAGWTDQELWALSYNGLGGNSGTALATPNPERDAEHREMGWDGNVRVTDNEVNVADLHDFVLAVRAYTGSDRFSLVGHSLGVTLARRTLKVHPELREDLVAFVGIAGGNHGTSFCPPGSEGQVVSCDEIASGTEWLAELNGPDGEDETYGPAAWLTVYDGSGAADPAFAGPPYAESPALLGADNRSFPGTYHNDLRIDPEIVEVYRTFLEAAEPDPLDPPVAPSAAPSGGSEAVTPTPATPVGPRQPSIGGVGGVALAAPGPPADGDLAAGPPPAAGVGTPIEPVSVTTVERIGRHWSSATTWAFVVVLLAGLALLVLDQRRRRPSEVR